MFDFIHVNDNLMMKPLSYNNDEALRAALPLLSSSPVARLAVQAGLQMVREKMGIPVDATYSEPASRWYVVAGEEGAGMRLKLELTTDALAALLEGLLPDVLAGKPLSPEKLLEVLRPNLRRR